MELFKRHWPLLAVIIALPTFASFGLPMFREAGPLRWQSGARPGPTAAPALPPAVPAEPEAPIGPTRTSVPLPALVKGIYITSATVGSARRFAELIDLVDRTELNALVIDLKNGNGELAFLPETEELKSHVEKRPTLGRLRELAERLHAKGIYLIARNFVFQDPALAEKRKDLAVKRAGGALWRDRKGIPWLDPVATEVWEYNAAIAREAYEAGFDEIQFDYIRFPSDGAVSAIVYPFYDGRTRKADVLRDFFSYLDGELRQKRGIPISADLFGLVMWQHDFDLNIGQRLDVAAHRFDFISPMVYPSHYPNGFNGYKNPALYPYEVIYQNLVKGEELLSRLRQEYFRLKADRAIPEPPPVASVRPWIQDFDLGADYNAAMVRAQMKASEDGGASGWLLWNAKNVYTESALRSQ